MRNEYTHAMATKLWDKGFAMLEKLGRLTSAELEELTAGLKEIAAEIEAGRFVIEPDTEDVHSQVELMLTRRLGDAGKKIHSGR